MLCGIPTHDADALVGLRGVMGVGWMDEWLLYDYESRMAMITIF